MTASASPRLKAFPLPPATRPITPTSTASCAQNSASTREGATTSTTPGLATVGHSVPNGPYHLPPQHPADLVKGERALMPCPGGKDSCRSPKGSPRNNHSI